MGVPPGGLLQSFRNRELEKEQERARTRIAAAIAAEGARNFVQKPQAPPPPSADPAPAPKVGTGPSSTAERPQKGANPAVPPGVHPYYGGVKAVKDSRGRITFTGPEEAQAHARAGATAMDYGQAVMEAGDPRGSTQDLVDVAEGSESKAYLRPGGRGSIPAPVDTRPYSSKVRDLASSSPVDARTSSEGEYGWTFTGGLGTGKAREGTRKLDPLEQSLSRRQFLESRADEEQNLENERAAMTLRGAQIEQQQRQAELPPPDPLELKRIEAEGRMGDARYRADVDLSQSAAAAQAYYDATQRINEKRKALTALPLDDPGRDALQREIDALTRDRLEIANIIGGHRLTDPRLDPFAAMAASLSGGAAGTKPAGSP